jgi:hypothetical protein
MVERLFFWQRVRPAAGVAGCMRGTLPPWLLHHRFASGSSYHRRGLAPHREWPNASSAGTGRCRITGVVAGRQAGRQLACSQPDVALLAPCDPLVCGSGVARRRACRIARLPCEWHCDPHQRFRPSVSYCDCTDKKTATVHQLQGRAHFRSGLPKIIMWFPNTT